MNGWRSDDLVFFSQESTQQLPESLRTFLEHDGLPQRSETVGGTVYSVLPNRLAAASSPGEQLDSFDMAPHENDNRYFLESFECNGRDFWLIARDERDPYAVRDDRELIGIDQSSFTVDWFLESYKTPTIIPFNTSLEAFVRSLSVYREFATTYWEGDLLSIEAEDALVRQLWIDLANIDPEAFRDADYSKREPPSIWVLGIPNILRNGAFDNNR